ncbi:neuropeptide F receptor-like [Brevipalpus obovatus]|uniref:neuropeptide F receptor-like n=1 Tax=Brevipalpus obovatus TaxID=246614 RepID=UPI003D9EC249
MENCRNEFEDQSVNSTNLKSERFSWPKEFQDRILEYYKKNRAIDSETLVVLLVSYLLMIAIGAIGNGLVSFAVLRKPSMRTPRNLFILNLAISDLTLCLITMPFTLIEIVTRYWTLGKIACKLMTGMQATSIFVSAMSITAIARDRYHVIVNPTQNSSKISNTLIRTIFIWAFALLLASPLFFYKRICQVTVPDAIADRIDTPLYYCFEDWPSTDSRNNYSLFTCIFQYLLPTIIVVISYTHIYQKLKGRMSQKRSVIKLDERIKAEEKRTRRTNTLLISISLIFCISWMPLYILNLISDFKLLKLDDKDYRLVFAVCHIIGMSSACINPLLYGWLNDNFQKEFKEIFSVQL